MEDPNFNIDKEKDLMIMAMFEDELLSFQRKTFEHGIDEYFIPPGTIILINSIFTNLYKSNSVIDLEFRCLRFY